MQKPLLVLSLASLIAAGAARAQDSTAVVVPPAPREVRVCAGGDVTIGTNLDTTWAPAASRKFGMRVPAFPNPDSLLFPLRALVEDADVVLLNVEGAIGQGWAPRKCRPGSTMCFAFRMPPTVPAALRGLRDSGEVVGNVANNHAGDAGPEGRAQTVARLGEAGVHVTGYDTEPTVVVTAAGDTIAFLGFATSGPPNDVRDLATVRRLVERAARDFRRVVVTMHMGAEGPGARHTRDVMEEFAGGTRGNPVAFARTAVAAGADLVIGHGPHVLRAVEWRGDALVAYSLGNLLTYGPFTLTGPNGRAGLLCATLDEDGKVLGAEIRPTRQTPPGIVEADAELRALDIIDDLSGRDFPSSGGRVMEDGTIVRRGIPVTKDRPDSLPPAPPR